MLLSPRRCFAAVLLLLPTACGSSDSDESDPATGLSSDLSAFPTACAGTLRRESDLLVENLSGAWASKSGLTAPAGSKVLWGKNVFGKLGYARLADGRVAQVQPFDGGDLTAEADLTTTCTGKNPVYTLLKPTAVYAKADLSGTPCNLPAGTTLPGALDAFKGADAPWELSGKSLGAACGFEMGWVLNLRSAELFSM